MVTHTEKSVDVNTATVEELSTVPGLGPAIAQRILDGRPYDTLEDLRKVRGIGPLFLDKIRPHLDVAAKEDKVVSEPPVMELIESESFPEGEEIESVQLQQLDEVEALEPVEAIQDSLEAAPITEPDIEPKPSEPVKEVAETQEEPLVAVGESSQSIFYPAEPEEEEEAEEIPRAIQVVESKAEEKKPAQEKKSINRNEIIAWVAGGGLVSILLSVLIVLGILGIINNSLRYMTAQQGSRQISALQGQLSDMEDQIGLMGEDIAGLRTRLDTLESFGGRISALEDQSETLSSDLADTKDQLTEALAQLEEINGQMETMTEELDNLKEASSLFETFLKGLQSLLNDTLPAETTEGVQP